MKIKSISIVFTVLACFGILASRAQVQINEYSCSNINTIADNFGGYEDWIELYNPGSSPVSLTGYYLSDNASNPTKWQIPSGSIAAGGYLLVFASGWDQVGGGYWHANFKLTQTKPEIIILANTAGSIIDSLTLKPAQANHSRGRTTDGASTWSVFTTPTPGAANTNAKQEYAARPVMSLAPGFYTGTQSVSITCSTPGATIYYTLNGNEPTTSSTVYSAPLSISTTAVVRAIAAVPSNSAIPTSFAENNTYFINITHTVPVLSIYGTQLMPLMQGNGWGNDPLTGLEFFDKTGAFRTETTGSSNKHGNDSWAYDQRGIDFVAKDQFGYNYVLKHKIFTYKNRNKFQRIIIKAAANDNYPFAPGQGAHIRDSYVHTLSQQGKLSLDERTWEPCVLYVNGQYWGVYDIREKVDDADFTEYYYDQKEEDLQFLKTWGATWSEYGGSQAQADWNSFLAFVNSNNMAVQANYDYVDSVYNIKSLVDYFAINSYTVSSDWLNWNTAWWRGLDPNGDKKKWRYALWDLDATFGHYYNYTGIPNTSPTADPCNADNLPDPGGQGHTVILNKLMANPTFKQYYISRYIDLGNTTFSCPYMINLLDSMINVIAPEMPGQVAKWGGSMSGWQSNVQQLRNFINARCTAIQQGMIDCYSLSGPYNVRYEVQPAGAGSLKINSISPPSYPFTGTYYGGIDILLKANANGSYIFDYWEVKGPGIIAPSTADTNVTLNISAHDTIIAHFRLPEDPPGASGGGALYVPNAFSPNGDGINDVLYVLGENFETFEFVVYNRWGQVVFQTTQRNQTWDGTFNGKPLNTDVFAYRLSGKTTDGKTILKSGNVTLIR